MTLPWYPRDMGKYARDTKHLTMLEHGAYTLMLDYYYSTGSLPQVSNASSNASLMPDHSRIYRLCSAMNKPEQDAVDAVLKLFFKLDKQGFYRNAKADIIIEEQELKHNKRVEAGRKGGKSNASSNAASNTPQKKKEKENHIHSADAESVRVPHERMKISGDDFAEFFKAYPKPTAMGAARSSFTNAILMRGANAKQIINAAKNYAAKEAKRPDDEMRYIPNPSKWLDDECYNDPHLQEQAKTAPKVEDFTGWHKKAAEVFGVHIAKAWFQQCTLNESTGIITAPSRFVRDHINQHYAKDLKEMLGVTGIKFEQAKQ